MQVEQIRTAENLARKFAKDAGQLVADSKTEGGKYLLYGGKRSGALRRLSMDLTRALAEMRKP